MEWAVSQLLPTRVLTGPMPGYEYGPVGVLGREDVSVGAMGPRVASVHRGLDRSTPRLLRITHPSALRCSSRDEQSLSSFAREVGRPLFGDGRYVT